jgi:hypothetical protein
MEDQQRTHAEKKEQFLLITSELIDVAERWRKLKIPTGPGPTFPDYPFDGGEARRHRGDGDDAPRWAHRLLDAIWGFFSSLGPA